jgi:hypothetical protein
LADPVGGWYLRVKYATDPVDGGFHILDQTRVYRDQTSHRVLNGIYFFTFLLKKKY